MTAGWLISRTLSLVMNSDTTVAPAAIAANGMFIAKPQASRCGFMMLIHVHSSTPIHVWRQAKGSAATTIPSRVRARMAGSLGDALEQVQLRPAGRLPAELGGVLAHAGAARRRLQHGGDRV